MNVTSSSSSIQSTPQIDAMKKAMDVQKEQITKVLESATEQSKEVTAQKTGVGNNINITA